MRKLNQMFTSLLTNNDHPVYSKNKYVYSKRQWSTNKLSLAKKDHFIIFYSFLFIFRRRKKRSQKTKFYEAYKVTMYSMANELKCLMWGIKWKAIKFCANCIEYRTFHQSLRFSSDPPTYTFWFSHLRKWWNQRCKTGNFFWFA